MTGPALLLVAAAAGAGVLVWLGAHRVEHFVVAVLVVRTSLDALSGLGPDGLTTAFGALFLAVAGSWLLVRWRWGELVLSPLSRSALAFLGAALLAVAVSPSIGPALVEWTRLAGVAVMLLVVEQLAGDRDVRRRVVHAVIVAAVAPVVVALVQEATDTGLLDAGGFRRVTGTFVHPNPLAAFGAVVVVLLVAQAVHLERPLLRWACAAGAALTGVAVYLTYTRAAWLAVVAGLLLVAVLSSRALLVGVVAAVCVAALAVPGTAARFSDLTAGESPRGESGNSLAWRVGYWQEALELSERSPVTGIGLKQVVEQSVEGKQPHNDFVRAYVEMGVLGLLTFCWFLLQLLATARRAVRAARLSRRHADGALAAGYAGVVVGYVLMSSVANLASQVVVGLYVAALAGAASALVRAPARPLRIVYSRDDLPTGRDEAEVRA